MEGPSDDTFARLASMIPSMVNGRVNGAFAPKPGGKLCAGCGVMFGLPSKDGMIAKDVCKSCKKFLRAGGTIFTTTDHRAYSVMPKEGASFRVNPKWKGKIVQIPAKMMDDIEKLLTPGSDV